MWPRYGHLRGILQGREGYQGTQPNFHKWARPAYEQGALPTLSLLPEDVASRVLPGDKIYQAMKLNQTTCDVLSCMALEPARRKGFLGD